MRNWTTGEINYLITNAGHLSKREICKQLKRKEGSVRAQAHRLGISLRCFVPSLSICPKCGKARSVFGESGFCGACDMRDQLEAAENRCSVELSLMTLEDRAIYEDTEAQRGVQRIPQRPVKQVDSNATWVQSMKRDEDYEKALERWEMNCLQMRINACKTRLKRMRQKTGRNPRGYKN